MSYEEIIIRLNAARSKGEILLAMDQVADAIEHGATYTAEQFDDFAWCIFHAKSKFAVIH